MWILLLFQAMAFASDFACETDGTQIKNNVIYACGVGESTRLNEAREFAITNAHAEAMYFYYNNSSLALKPKDERPARQECHLNKKLWVCHRLLIVTVQTDALAKN